MATLNVIQTGIAGTTIELQPRFGERDGAVLHMLPGGVGNPEGFGQNLLDVYASTAKGQGVQRGGHYHLKLDELFFTLAGTALWILSDFRPESPTYQTTVGIILGDEKPATDIDLPVYVTANGSLARLRIPAGVYHTYLPLTAERVTVVGLGSTPYDKADYVYPEFYSIPKASELLKTAGVELTNESASK